MSFIDYVRDTKGELKHVSWPTRKQAMAFTALVVALSLAVSLYLGFFDFLFTFFVEKIIL